MGKKDRAGSRGNCNTKVTLPFFYPTHICYLIRYIQTIDQLRSVPARPVLMRRRFEFSNYLLRYRIQWLTVISTNTKRNAHKSVIIAGASPAYQRLSSRLVLKTKTPCLPLHSPKDPQYIHNTRSQFIPHSTTIIHRIESPISAAVI